MIFRIILSIAGFLLVAEGIGAASISNLNLGIVMPFVIGIPLIVVGVSLPAAFHRGGASASSAKF